jgi:xylan 1,4-beta-xylosidase
VSTRHSADLRNTGSIPIGRLTIQNPVLRGFNPDPSVIRVGEDYFATVSTVHWFPGARLYQSRDLAHWRPIGHALDRLSQLDLRGVCDGGGVWSPFLSHHGHRFHIVYSLLHVFRGAFVDASIYWIDTAHPQSDWSDPVLLVGGGWDPALFHDEDGRTWLVYRSSDHRLGRRPGGITIRELDISAQRLTGPTHEIFAGTELGTTEAPHLYKHGGWYYLMTAEGGSGFGHAVTMARSRRIEGPYRLDPQNPLLTSRDNPDLALQKAGHACLFDTPEGRWYLAFLCTRPTVPGQSSVLGRETALAAVRWSEDGWLRLESGGHWPRQEEPGPTCTPYVVDPLPRRDNFDSARLSLTFHTLRLPADESWLSLTERPGFLRLRGQESPASWHRVSLVARRLESHHAQATTCVEFEPETFQHLAGLIAFYDAYKWMFLYISVDDLGRKVVGVKTRDDGRYEEPLGREHDVQGWTRVHLRLKLHQAELRFSFSHDGRNWIDAGQAFDATRLADEHGAKATHFTGTTAGLCCVDLTGSKAAADFDYFEYRDLE